MSETPCPGRGIGLPSVGMVTNVDEPPDDHAGVRVLVVDDHPVFRRGLVSVFAGESWITAIFEAGNARQALETCVRERPDVVILDIRLPDRDGVTVTGEILRAHPKTAVLLVTMLDQEDLVLGGLRAGARGYVLKSSNPIAIVSALRTVADGGLVLGPGVHVPLSTPGAGSWSPAPFDRLSKREREVVAEVAKGCTNLQIARRLGISEKTVRNMVSSVLAATGTPHRIALALLANERGLVKAGRGRYDGRTPDTRTPDGGPLG